MTDLETLRTQYEAAQQETGQQYLWYLRAKAAMDKAANELVAAMKEQGLTEYGPITSKLNERNDRIYSART